MIYDLLWFIEVMKYGQLAKLNVRSLDIKEHLVTNVSQSRKGLLEFPIIEQKEEQQEFLSIVVGGGSLPSAPVV